MRRLTYFGVVGLTLICLPASAQNISQRVAPFDGAPNHGDWIIPAGAGAGAIYRMNGDRQSSPSMRIEYWDDKVEDRHWITSGGYKQCLSMGRRNGLGKLIRFIPGSKPGEGMCVFAGRQTSF